MPLQIDPLVAAERATLENVVERLRHRLQAATLTIGQDLVGEGLLPVGDKAVRVDHLELDRVGAGLGRDLGELARRLQTVVGRTRLERNETGLVVADCAQIRGSFRGHVQPPPPPGQCPIASARAAATRSTSSSARS